MKNFFLRILLFFVCIAMVSCGPKVIRLSNVMYAATTDIEVLTEFPTHRQFEKIAILTNNHGEYFTTDQMINAFKNRAMKLGANALVIEKIAYSVWSLTINATAIRYK